MHAREVTVKFLVRAETAVDAERAAELVADEMDQVPDTMVETILDWRTEWDNKGDVDPDNAPPRGDIRILRLSTEVVEAKYVEG